MNALEISYIFSLLGLIILSLFIFQKRNANNIAKAFFFFTLFTILWQVSLLSSELFNSDSLVLFTAKLAIATGTFMALFFYYFCHAFSREKNVKVSILSTLLIIASIFGLLSFTRIITQLDDSNEVIVSTGYTLNTIFVVGLLIGGALEIISKAAKSLNQRGQAKYLLFGIMIALIPNLLVGFVYAESSQLNYISWISPLSVFLMVSMFMIAVLRHRLLDIKPIVARTVSYIFITIIVTVLYVGLAFLVKRFFLPETKVETGQITANIILTVLLVLSFPYIKKWFDKLTNKFFFRDAYDPQELIDRLNQTLVTNVNLEELLTKSALIMQEEIKASFCTFYIHETSYFNDRIIGAQRKIPEFDDIGDIEKYALKIHTKVFSSESVSDVENEKKLAQALKKNDVEVMARLTNTLDLEVKGIGYIFMGPKKSGSMYTLQDLKIFEIIANELVIAIENALRFEEIEQFNATLQKKIEDATKELKKTNEKLKALDEAKDEFISMASHQLRTPLTSIKGYLSMVLEGDVGKISTEQRKMLATAFISSQRMVYLIADLLNVSRIQTGKFVIEPKAVYLPDVIADEIAQITETAAAKGITISYKKPQKFPTVYLDETKIRQVIMNFADNAVYYTPSKGEVTIELTEHGASIEFLVMDNGIGVPKDEQHKLFTKFYRAANARKARPDGTGLGLFMAQKVIIASGGAIIFKSKEGVGSTFGFTFPKK